MLDHPNIIETLIECRCNWADHFTKIAENRTVFRVSKSRFGGKRSVETPRRVGR